MIALNLVVNPELIIGTPGGGGGNTQAGVYVSKNQLGDLVQEFTEYSNSESASANECADCSTPAIIAALPWLKGILGCWSDISVPGASTRVIARVKKLMDIDGTFLPVAKELIDQVFPTAVTYHQHVDGTGSYDPATGTITSSDVDHSIKAGVLSRGRTENGGTGETYEITIWVHHGAGGLQFLPKTRRQLYL